jgi:Mg2+ and Co2+ transporter CorA
MSQSACSKLREGERLDVRWISAAGVEPRDPAEVPALLEREDGFLWVDIPSLDEGSARLLSDVFHFHPHAIRDCSEKRHIPKIHTYADHVFVILHDIEFGQDGRGHMLALDQFVGEQYLVTVHGPSGTHVPVESTLRETQSTLRRMESGGLQPKTPAELGAAIVSAIVLRLENLVSEIADQVAALERVVVKAEKRNPQEFVEQLYSLRHELLTVGTMAGLSREAYAGRLTVARSSSPPEQIAIIEDLIDQYEHLKSQCDAERGFLDQVLDFYQARTVTTMNIAMQRLALIAAVLLPITAISGIYGMNVIVNQETDFPHVAAVLVLMGVVIGLMLRWTKRQGWW